MSAESPKPGAQEKPPEETVAEGAEAEAEKRRVASDQRAGHVGAGFRARSWLYEIPVFYLLLAGLQQFGFPEHPGFREINPNPYWIGILLFSLRYGMIAGFAAGLVSAGLYCLGVFQAGDGFLLQDSDFYFRPGLFPVIGAAIGGAADNYAQQLASRDARILDLLEKTQGLQKQIVAEQKVLRAVEQQVVSQMSSIVTLFQGSRNLGTLDRFELLPAMLSFFTEALKATKAGLYVREGDRWVLFDKIGWEEGDAYATSERHGQGVVGLAASLGRVVSLKDMILDEEAGKPPRESGADALMAGPIASPSGEPIAVYAVQAMGFMRFNTASLNLLALLLEWGAESVAKCAQVADLRSQSVFDQRYAVHSTVYFDIQVAKEFGRSQRYALPCSLVFVGLGDFVASSEKAKESALNIVGRVLRESARSVDIVALTPLSDAPFAVLMPTATRESAVEFRERLRAAFAKLELPAPVRFGIASYAADMKSKEELIEQAKRDFS